MCDYSLDFVASPTVGEPSVAVCVLPGTEIAFEQEVEYCHSLSPNQKVAERLARFRQINLEQAFVHHSVEGNSG
jgi:hypothetical protein